MKDVFIYSAKRTAIGSFQGALAGFSATELGAIAAKSALSGLVSGIESEVDEAIVGCVLPAALGQAPARQVALASGLQKSTRALTVNKVCGSGLKAVAMAADRVALDRAQLVLTGGIESMSNVPFYIRGARSGLRMGHQELTDGMILDGLWDVYNQFHMGKAGELCAKHFKFTRESQDAYAAESYRRAKNAVEKGLFVDEIAAAEKTEKKEKLIIAIDEEPGRGKIEKLSTLRAAFETDGTITAGNASSINDGAAMLFVGSHSKLKPIARIIHQAEFAHEPEWFTTAPVSAIRKLLSEASLKVSDIAVFEVNEAFAVVAMAAAKELEIAADKMNPRGGAVALGHPIGASGARLLVTLLHQLKPGEKGVVSLCIGGGEANALLVEKL